MLGMNLPCSMWEAPTTQGGVPTRTSILEGMEQWWSFFVQMDWMDG